MTIDLDSALETAIVDRLASDAAIVAELPELYRGILPIFSRWPVPEDAPDVFIVVSPPATANQSGSKTSCGRDVIRDVSAYTLATGDPRHVNRIANLTLSRLRRWQPTLEGGARVLVAEPSGPIGNDGDGTYGRVVSVRFVVHGT